MRTTLILLLVLLCAATANAQVSPADTVPLDHWAYDAFALLNDVTDGALSSPYWDEAFSAGALTRYQCAIGVMQTLEALLKSDMTVETPDVEGYAWAWHELAAEFLPELLDVGDDATYLRNDTYAGAPPHPDGPTQVNTAIEWLRSVPHDHRLYPEAQRILWAAADMSYEYKPTREDTSPANSVPFDHWAYHSLKRLAPLVSPDRGAEVISDRALTRYEVAVLSLLALRTLGETEEPTPGQEELAVTWALLALEFWPELVDLSQDLEVLERDRPDPRRWGEQAPLLYEREEVLEDHWLYPIVMRVLRIAEGAE